MICHVADSNPVWRLFGGKPERLILLGFSHSGQTDLAADATDITDGAEHLKTGDDSI
jgi:hypothetical protein